MADRTLLLVLDDDDDRVRRFRAVLRRVAPELRLRSWKDARRMCREMDRLLPRAALISLDHDLKWRNGAPLFCGSGDGVAGHLAALPPACPVIVHTNNPAAGTRMCGRLRRAGWTCSRVHGEGEKWIEHRWSACLRRRLGQPAG